MPIDLPPGLELSRAYDEQVVRPLLERHAAGLAHAAGRLGSGSDVLGFDDEQSRDHDWGLRLTLLVEGGRAGQIDALLDRELPRTWHGLPTRFATTWDPVVRQRVEVASAADLAASRLGIDAARLEAAAIDGADDLSVPSEAPASPGGRTPPDALTLTDWLQLTGQAVLEVTAGPVFRDGPGVITALRGNLAWYPRDVWMYALAADWSRLGQEFPDVGRAGLRGDEDGSAVIAARHVRTLLHLAHLLHRRWPPYGKWLARSAARLPDGQRLRGVVGEVLAARDWRARQAALAAAAELLATIQGEQGLPTLSPATEPFFERPHIGVRGLPELLLAQIRDPAVRALPPGVGTAEQISDNATVLVDPAARRRLVGP
ncbi:hypothetical protein BH708_04075 [Brachybacterium sp. P6-10-X1]|uniref:DUF4037 domain-containing protein n=1 Tax=Brachybacterium sp. P6-10-X1 TaxID=1903186 RepID=UPI0009719AC1|nr:DUF4037 domain-containing protein [Brachybacterium sp. P6-10-X1]APX32043.1 hypothetical protein BH708_04075 [Brachybacterium sp. P6-10-X1]